MSESETDKTDLRNVEFYLKTDVANTIKSLKLPPNPYMLVWTMLFRTTQGIF